MHRISRCRKALVFAGLFLLLLLLAGQGMRDARAERIVPRHDLDCSVDFPCPEALQRRVDFWVEVFSRWDGKTAILHDYDEPWRVYQAIEGVDGCSAGKVKRERKRLKANLNALGDRLKQDLGPTGGIQNQLADQFDRLNSSIVYASARNIRCQLGVKDQFEGALGRFERYRGLVAGIIADADMPDDLLYLPFVESSYRADSWSKVGAAGMWQIMPNTARSLGMELNAVLDERLDPEAATLGAMRYFKNAQDRLIPLSREKKPGASMAEINPFIVTSYNYGINGMRRAIRQLGPDFPRVLNEYKSAAFQVAVKNFYASFLAARFLARNSEQYFGDTIAEAPLTYQTYVLPVPTSIERIKHQFALSQDDLKPLNPALTRFAWNNWRLVPAGYRLRLPYREHRWTAQIDRLEALPPEPESRYKVVYRVRKGDTACAIAQAFDVSCRELIDANRLGKRAMIRIGQQLDIPGRAPTAAVASSAASSAVTSSGAYKVRAGDTACGIAERFGVACRELIRINELGRKAKIYAGQNLKIPGLDGQPVAQVARLDYTVRQGDTVCEIAQRYAVACNTIIADNRLNGKGTIRVGQVLTIRGRSGEASNNVAVSEYRVRSGDTACEIAERFDIPCSTLIRTNRLGKEARLQVGQVLKITSVVGPEAINAGITAEQKAWLDQADTPPDMSLVSEENAVGLTVLPDETLAHYADWMGARGSAELRQLNGLQSGQEIQPGQRIRLPIDTQQNRDQFSRRRSEFHQVLAEEFKERFRIIDVESVTVRSGQSLWSIAKQYETPMWLLVRFNPELDAARLQPGQTLRVARIESKS